MGTTGLIYVAIVAAWAAYLVPMMLKRNDEASRRRSAEAYSSSAARVLSRADGTRARYVVRPPGTAVTTPAGTTVTGTSAHGATVTAAGTPVAQPPPPRYIPNRARRVAAMRRRRVLSILTLSLLSMTALAGLGILLWWSVSIPAGLIVAFIVLTRVQLRRQARERAARVAERRARAAARHDRGPAVAPPSSPDNELTVEVQLPVAEPPAPKVETKPISSEGLWDPVPVTLPTYVLKEKAPDRTVRTINLSGPDVFSSARIVEPEPTAPPIVPDEVVEPEVEPEIKRAVGD
jgi:type II secretory pathway pseudopilin PulG